MIDVVVDDALFFGLLRDNILSCRQMMPPVVDWGRKMGDFKALEKLPRHVMNSCSASCWDGCPGLCYVRIQQPAEQSGGFNVAGKREKQNRNRLGTGNRKHPETASLDLDQANHRRKRLGSIWWCWTNRGAPSEAMDGDAGNASKTEPEKNNPGQSGKAW
ncbi:hypothetical protein ZHAS_00002665 [Anopheles sinensis]|uniref:Uncharacterized protein n=1 Tax=Anopheles sinensis TaxID=74873 RepID=A0A084VCR8_ANOSI|nr:hypothetical protein ZHAS_00002665 [Anopheles sinensis]